MQKFVGFILGLTLRLTWFGVIYFVFVKLMGIPLETVLLIGLAVDAIFYSWKNAKEM